MVINYATVHFFFIKLAEHVGVDLTNSTTFLLHCCDLVLINGTGFLLDLSMLKVPGYKLVYIAGCLKYCNCVESATYYSFKKALLFVIFSTKIYSYLR